MFFNPETIMKVPKITILRQIVALFILSFWCAIALNGQSVYTQKPEDSSAMYFLPGEFDFKADGKTDVSEALQSAVNKVAEEQGFGILFLPEGKYLISKTIYVPRAIRIIGYGKNRPEIILGKNTPGFQDEQNYMFWFTNNLVAGDQQPRDAGAGTFYSAISNIDFRIEKGNSKAVALRTHFAQHCFVSHCNFYIGEAYAGIYDLGNEIEGLNFFGGQYGITSSRTSPGWPMMMIDLYFEGQSKAAVISRNTGMTIVSMHVKNVPVAVQLQEGVPDRLFMEDCLFENVKRGLVIGVEEQATNQINLINIICHNVDIAVDFTKSGKSIKGAASKYLINDFTYGLVMSDMSDHSSYRTLTDIRSINEVPGKLDKVIPYLPDMESWVNIKDFGAVGNGLSDDTPAFRKAIEAHENIYLPTGTYRITETIKLEKETKLIGLHPFATQLKINECEAGFSGFGGPVPVLESSEGGNNVVTGIGINTGAFNYRAVGIKWLAGENSLVNDVKFIGGHGTLFKPGEGPERRRRNLDISSPSKPVYSEGMDLAWDRQYWSLWVTNGGGGILKDIWTANTYAAAGLYISNTASQGRVYAMSLEHHVRQECRLNNVSNWRFYAFQFEEEGREGKDCLPLDMSQCKDLMFANFWIYRVIRVNTPRQWGIRVSDCQNIDFRNMRSWTQVLYLPERTVFDMNKNLVIYPGDFARATVTGLEKANRPEEPDKSKAEKLSYGYEFARGAVSDSKGNVYFCENQQKRIYKYSSETNAVSIYADYPFKPFSLAIDTRDNLLVVCRYDPQPGYMINGQQEGVGRLPDDNPNYSGWGNGGWSSLAYAIAPDRMDDMQPLKLIKTSEARNVKRVIHPTHRWRSDFSEIAMGMSETSFLAPDGLTIIPNTYDLGRSMQLLAVCPNQTQAVYVTHEDPKISYRFDVDSTGRLCNMQKFVSRGEYSNLMDVSGNLFLAEGEIIVFDKNGNELRRITLDDRVQTMTWGGKDRDVLYVTTSDAFYRIDP